ncbi:hypothetical protein MTR_2g023300 [Medicago truncatula]|uniref:Uncharacterized protein n=1 Tax=Medicago truncatula TaxID=3880 RepID=A0A072VFG4_MEDTR|nr:hypothetical protein MTR_2g023300 [Medicago truncatula]
MRVRLISFVFSLLSMVTVRLISTSRTRVHIVVSGEQRTGKFTLIRTAFIEDFCENVAPVLPPTREYKKINPNVNHFADSDEIDEKIDEELRKLTQLSSLSP